MIKHSDHIFKNSKNPILSPSPLPHRAIPFTEIHVDHFLPALKEAIALAKKQMSEIGYQSDPPSFANTIEAMEIVGEQVDLVSSVFYNLLNAETSEKMQALAEEIGPLLANYSSDILLDTELFSRVKAVYESEKTKESSELNPEQRTLLEHSYLDFARNGAMLSSREKDKLREIDVELSKMGPHFNQNVLKATTNYFLHLQEEEDVAGLPDSLKVAAAETAKERKQEGWIFTLDAPSIIPFLKYADNREHRRSLWIAYNSRCNGDKFDNTSTVKRIVNLRFERAQLLGYRNHADFVLRKRMAETPEKVHEFLENLLQASLPAARRELSEITRFAQSLGGPSQLMPWDFAYYSEKYKKSHFDFDEEELRPYFQLEKVIAGAFEHARLLYGLEFKESHSYPTYHKEVKVFEVSKMANGDFIGLLYTDFFPRSTKKSGAWMTNYYEQGSYAGDLLRPHVGIVCNFTKPTADKPSLLTFDEVETLFHEFGHALHSLLSHCHYRSLSGTNVYRDFVELPSQIMENWASEKEGLQLFAHHYLTGEEIPDHLTQKIQESTKFLAGYNFVRQLNFATLDLSWHDTDPRKIDDIVRHEREATKRSSLLPHVDGVLSSVSFSHIFGGGYSAGYYSYKWAEVLDADAFEFFKEQGLFSEDVARLFEENILSKGGSEHPMELYKRFRGREPDPNALLRKFGLI